jgi:alanyl-tRNA synthetase
MLKPGIALALEVDHARRGAIRKNHSATHLLHEALRQVLGDHVAQKGSLVSPDRLRFDIAHPKPISDDELAAVEDIANRVVLENAAVVTRLMGIEEARESGPGRCLAKNTATKCASSRWARSRAATTARALFQSNSAAAPMSRAPATSA